MAKVTDLYVDIGAKTDKLQNSTNNIEGIFKRIGGLVAGAFAVSKIAGFISASSELAAKMEGVQAAFNNIAQPGLLDGLQKATKNTVNNLELMKAAVRANNFQIPLEQMASLLEFATKRAQQTGESIDYLVESIVLGIGRKSPLILDNLGISAIRLREELKGVGVEAASVGDIAAIVGKIAQEEMRKAGDIIETTAVKTAQLKASWENLKIEVGNTANVMVQKVMPALQGLMDELAAGANVLSNQQIPLWRKLLGLINPELRMANRLQSQMKDALAEQAVLQQNVNKETEIAGDVTKTQVGLIGELESKIKTLEDSLPAIMDRDKLAAANDEIIKLKEQLDELYNLTSQRGGSMDGGLLDSLGAGLNTQDDFLAKWYEDRAKRISEANVWIQRSMERTANAANTLAGEIMGVGVNSDSMEDFAKAAANAARKAISAWIAEAVAQQVLKAMANSKNPWVGLVLGAAAGGATAALFNSIVPAFAEGGVVKGKQLAMVGDNPSGVEAIIPKEKWGMFGSTRITGELQLRGRDLWWSIKNYETFTNKTT